MKAVTFIFDAFRKFPWLLVGGTVLLVLEGLAGAVAIFTVAPVIDFFLAPDLQQASPITVRVAAIMQSVGLPVSLGSFVAVFVSLQVLKNGFAIFVRYCLVRIRFSVLRELMIGTFKDVFRAKWMFFVGNRQGTILNSLRHEMEVVGSALGVMMLFLAHLIQLVCYLAVPWYVSWQVTSLSLATALVSVVPFLLLGRANYRLGTLGTSTNNQMSTVIQESLGMAKLVLGFGNQRRSVRDLERAFDAHRWVAHRFHTLQAATPLTYEPLGTLVLIVTVMAGRGFGVPLSEIAVMLWALRNCMPLVAQLATQKNALLHFVPSFEQIKDLRERARELEQPSGTRVFTGLRKGLDVSRVTFAYPGHEPVLTDISVSIPKGKMVAFVGESGAGKSTLVDMLMGFHGSTLGRITLDDVPLHEFDISSYRHRIGYVPQEAALFNLTIRENLRWAHETATDAEIKEACRRANADEFIERFPDGYETLVGDRGVRLSGGQCQRVALARAIVRQPALLILDEATSALDTHSERLIQQAIEAIAKETTVIVIAHRLSTIANADYIYVLQGGRIVEEGPYQTLMQQHGQFRRMTQSQLLEVAA